MMDFPKRICNFLYRHRRKLIFAGVLVGGVVGSVKYAQYKIKDWMTAEEKKYLEALKKQQHFEKTQEHCFDIVEAVVKALQEKVLSALDTQSVTDMLKTEKSAEKKLALWNDLKILVFARVATSVYIITLSAVLIRIQLNQLAAKIYAETSKGALQTINEETQKWFLSLSHEYIIDSKLNAIANELKKFIYNLTETLPLQCRVHGSDLDALFKSLHDRVAKSRCLSFHAVGNDDSLSGQNILMLLIPSPAQVDFKSSEALEVKKQLVNELWDVLDSDDCMEVFSSCVLKSFEYFSKLVGNSIAEAASCSKLVPKVDSSYYSVPLAKVLPLLNSKVHVVDSPAFIHKALMNNTLSKFSANVYESFSDQMK